MTLLWRIHLIRVLEFGGRVGVKVRIEVKENLRMERGSALQLVTANKKRVKEDEDEQ